jgi:type I restriction enzyme S subunit
VTAYTRLRRFVSGACDGPFGSAIASEHYVDEGARVIRLGNIGSAEWLDEDEAFISLDYWRSLGRHHAARGDLVVAALGDQNNPVGRATAVPNIGPALVKADCHRLRLSPDAEARFLAYYLSSVRGRYEAGRMADGSTRKRLTLGKTLGLPVPDLAVDRQIAIADFLDAETTRIDVLTARKRRLVDLLGERATSHREACVTGSGKPTEIPSLGSVPPDWDVLRNKVFLYEVNDPSPDGSGEMLSVSHLTGVTPRSEQTVYMFEAESTVGYKRVRPGDLVINTMWAWMGAAGVSRHHGIVSPAYGVYRFRSGRVLAEYYDILIRSRGYIEEMTRFSRGVTTSRLRLYPDEFLRLFAPVPPIDQQRRLAAEFSAWSSTGARLVRQLGQQIDLLGEHRQALITAAVTGELEIPGVAA